jgi:hypothetical protein
MTRSKSDKKNDLMLFEETGETKYIAEEDLIKSGQLRLTESGKAQIFFKIPTHARVGVKFWLGDHFRAGAQFAKIDMNEDSTNTATGTGSGTGSGTGTESGTTSSVDTVAPIVTSVTSTTANGTFKTGDTISIQINLSENVTVTGNPVLNLETGSNDSSAAFASGTGTNVLNFSYTVGTVDLAADLDYKKPNTITLSAATIRDAGGNDLDLNSFPNPGVTNSLAASKNLKVDAVAPPPLDSVSGTEGSGKIDLTMDLPANVSDYDHIDVRRTTGATAPTSCTQGTSAMNIVSFSQDPLTVADNLAVGTYSYRFCIYDAAGNFDSSGVVQNKSISSGGASNSWKTPTSWSLAAAPTKLSIAMGTSTSDITVMQNNEATAGDDTLYKRIYNGSSWTATDTLVVASGVSAGISSHGVAYTAPGNQPFIIHGAGSFCVMNSTNTSMENGDCGLMNYGSNLLVRYSNLTLDTDSIYGPAMDLYNGTSWSSTTLPASEIPAGVRHDFMTGYPSAIFQDGSSNFKFRYYNPTTLMWSSPESVLSSSEFAGLEGFDYEVAGASQSAAVFFALKQSTEAYDVKVVTRNSTGTWQSPYQLISASANPGFDVKGGVDSGGKMVAVMFRSPLSFDARLFDGTSWASAISLDNPIAVSNFEVCSHPSSSTIFIAWLSSAVGGSKLKVRKIQSGVLDSTATEVHAPSDRTLEKLKMACNANAEASIVFHQRQPSLSTKEWGAVIYGP